MDKIVIEYIDGEQCAAMPVAMSDGDVRELRDYAVSNHIPLTYAIKRMGFKSVRCAMDNEGKVITLANGQVYRLFEKCEVQNDGVELAMSEEQPEVEQCVEEEVISEPCETDAVEPQEEVEVAEEIVEQGDIVYEKALEKRIDELAKALEEERAKCEALESERVDLLNEIENLKSAHDAHVKALTEKDERIVALEGDNARLVEQNETLGNEIGECVLRLEAYNSENCEPCEPEENDCFDEPEVSLEKALDVLRCNGIKSISLD